MPSRRWKARLDVWCELLETGRQGRLIVRGASMMPTVRPGWSVDVRSIRPARLRVGDVAVFLQESRLVAHRVVVSLGLGSRRVLVERGDGSPQARRLRGEAVLARVEEVLDDQGQRVPSPAWRWGWGKRLTVSSAVLLRLVAAKTRSVLTRFPR